jgi:hypothetical protein
MISKILKKRRIRGSVICKNKSGNRFHSFQALSYQLSAISLKKIPERLKLFADRQAGQKHPDARRAKC